MKQTLFLLALVIGVSTSQAQSIYYMRYDTVYIMRGGGNGELVLLNATRDTVGILANTGDGRTKFMKSRALNDSTLVIGPDTVTILGVGAANGLSREDGVVRLGGELDQETTISGSHILNFTNTRVYANKLLLNANLTYPVPTGYGNNGNNPPSLIVYDSARVGAVFAVKSSSAPVQISVTNANAANKLNQSAFNRDGIAVQQITAQSAGTLWQFYLASPNPRTMAGQVNGGLELFTLGAAGSGPWGYNYVPTVSAVAGFKSGGFAGPTDAGYTGGVTMCNDTSLFQVNAGGRFINFQNVAPRGEWKSTDRFLVVVEDSTLPKLGRTYKGTPFEGTAGYIQKSNDRGAMDNSVLLQTEDDYISIAPESIPTGSASNDVVVWDDADNVIKRVPQTNVSDEYTPTATAVSNLDAVTIQSAHYYRMGGMCIVYISFTADPTSAAECVFGVSLPIASNLGASSEVIGNGNAAGAGSLETVTVNGDTGNDRANVTFTATGDSSRSYTISFSYKITPP